MHYKKYPGDAYAPILPNFDRSNPGHTELVDCFVDLFFSSTFNAQEDTLWNTRSCVTPPLNYLVFEGLTYEDMENSLSRLYNKCKAECGEIVAEKRYAPEYMVLNPLGKAFCEINHTLFDPQVFGSVFVDSDGDSGSVSYVITEVAARTLTGGYGRRLERVFDCIAVNDFNPAHPALGFLLMIYKAADAAAEGYYPCAISEEGADND